MALPSNCRLCHAGIHEQFVTTRHVYGGLEGQAFYECRSCGVHYQFPPIPEEVETKLYASEFEKFMEKRAGAAGSWRRHPSEHVSSNQDHVDRRLRYLEPLISHKEALDICEIGCSSGFMLYPLKKQGHHVCGVEPSGIFGGFLKENGIRHFPSVEKLMSDGKAPIKFDIVMHFFVLEHIKEPLKFIAMNLALLKKGGSLVIEIPNAADPLHTVYQVPAFERFYWSLPHHWYFTERSFDYLLRNIHQPYEIKRDQRYDLSNHMTWALTGRPGGKGKFTPQLGSDLEEQYKSNLVKRGLCDTLIAIIRKENE